jgi:septum formation protein
MIVLGNTRRLILASASPRRQSLLSQIIDKFDIKVADIDETPKNSEQAHNLVERLALFKAKHVMTQCAQESTAVDPSIKQHLLIGSDTVVAQGSSIFGKPQDYNDFRCIMQQLSGREHTVFTGVCVVSANNDFSDFTSYSKVIETKVSMAHISEQEKRDYWETNEPQDKAGGYAIQGIGGQFVKAITGSFSAVVGLPLYETKQLLQAAIS